MNSNFDWFGLAYALAFAKRESLGIAAVPFGTSSKSAAISGEVRGAVASPLPQDSCGALRARYQAVPNGSEEEIEASPAGIHTGEVIDILTRMVIRAEEHAEEESSDSETQRELDSARSQGWR